MIRELTRGDANRRPFTRALVTLLTVSIVLLPLEAAARKPHAPEPAPAIPGTLVIYSITTGAEVEIDGRVVGTIPLEDDFALEQGQHTIRVFRRGFSEHNDTFMVPPGGEVELEIDLIPVAGILTIEAAEEGATVTVNGKVMGVTPFDQDVSPGKSTVVISKPGFYDDMHEVEVVAGQAYSLKAELKALPVSEQPVAEGEATTAVYETWWFWTIMGVIVAGSAATAVALTVGQDGGSQGIDADLTLVID